MSVNTVAKGVVINLAIDILLMMFLVYYKFNLSMNVFSLILLSVLFLTSIYIGNRAPRFPQAHGFFVGILSVTVLVLSLYVTVEMNWELNAILAIIWSFVAFIGALIGGRIGKSSSKREKKKRTEKLEVETV